MARLTVGQMGYSSPTVKVWPSVKASMADLSDWLLPPTDTANFTGALLELAIGVHQSAQAMLVPARDRADRCPNACAFRRKRTQAQQPQHLIVGLP